MNTRQKLAHLHNLTKMSVFYPENYSVAVFSSATDIEPVRQALYAAGWATDSIVYVSGAEFIDWNREHTLGKGIVEKLEGAVAELIGQETEFVKDFLDLAEQGGQFLTIYTPTFEDDAHLVEALKPFKPVKVSDYQSGQVVDLVVTSD